VLVCLDVVAEFRANRCAGPGEPGVSASFTVEATDAEDPPMSSGDILLTIPFDYNIQG
jgi:hypothetical protein